MLQPKDTDLLAGYKNRTHIYAVYKRPASDLEIHTDWKWQDGERYSLQMELKRAWLAILVSDKIDLKIKNIISDKEGH